MSFITASDWSHRELLWQHFRQPVGAEALKSVSATAETVDSSRTQQLRVEISLSDQHIINDSAFKAFGGVALMACGSWLCEWLRSKTLQQLRQLKPGELVEKLTQQLELLPAEKPMAFLAEDIVPQLLAAIEKSKN